MPAKKQSESPKVRRQKLLDYFHSRPRQPRFLSEIKDDLKIKNEQNLRRDLELLVDAGILEKSKDHSKQPARAIFTLKKGAAKALANMEDAPAAAPAKTPPAPASEKKAPKAKPVAAASESSQVKGRSSARELEQQILNVLEKEPTTVKDLADQLKRQQPTVTKALERMIERKLVERKRQGRPYTYSRLGKAVAAAAATSAAPAVAAAPAKAIQAAFPVSHQAPLDVPAGFQSVIESAIHAAINAAIDRILAEKSK